MDLLQKFGSYLVVAIMAIIGGGSCLAAVFGIIGTLIFKVYRMIKYGKSLYD